MKTTPNGRGLGWRPQKPDHRDMFFGAPQTGAALPATVDLRSHMPPVYDQGQLGSCTGNAIAAALEYCRMKEGRDKDETAKSTPSRLMIYYLEREIEGSIPWDAGAEIRDGLKAVANTGACYEDLWPYDIGAFTEKPPAKCYSAAKNDRATKYLRVTQTSQQLRGTLAAGFPIVFGFTCFPAIDSQRVAESGVLPMPGAGDAPVGGHAALAVGYDDSERRFLVRNSWGPDWGQGGYFWMDYEYLQRGDLSSDFWCIQFVGRGPRKR